MHRRLTDGSTLAALALAGLIAAVDIAIRGETVVVGLLVGVPLITCLRGSVAQTAGMGIVALMLALVLAGIHGTLGETQQLVRILIIGMGAGLGVAVAWLRERAARQTEQLARTEHHKSAMIAAALDCVITMDHEGRVVEFNPAAETTFGYTREEVVGREMAELLIPPALRERHRAGLARVLRTGETRILGRRLELTAMRSDGSEFPVELTVTTAGAHGEAPLFAGFVRDITERRKFQDRLAHQALHDELTGLPNRSLFIDRVASALGRAQRDGGTIAALFLDVDRFKAINDGLGHSAGDEVLVALAERFRGAVRPGDTVARYGGDEFAVLCEEVGTERDALEVAERLTRAASVPVEIGGRDVVPGVSVGAALSSGGHDPEGLLSEADAAMYRAKQANEHYALFDEPMRTRAAGAMQTELQLRRALEREELRVIYQPQVDLATGELTGFEALVRWQHPDRGLLAPTDFIPLAEDVGLIGRLGDVVLEEACRAAQAWSARSPDSRPLRVSVNLSARQLAQPTLTNTVDEVLRRTQLDPGSLCLEITESVLMDNAATTITQLRALNGMGVMLAIDDFGTGYSSLAYLRRFPVHQLKVDRSFTEGLGRRGDDSAIVAAIVSMGHALGLAVLAEGVESVHQRQELEDLGCDLAQGFLFAPGLAGSELEQLVGERRRFIRREVVRR